MEQRKQKEIEYYDKKTNEQLKTSFSKKSEIDFDGFNPFILERYKFLRNFLKDKCKNKIILDYGCGNGIHSVWLAKYGAEVIGIDLSEKSLEVARERIKRENLKERVEFLKMDCEKMKFPNDYFDIIFDGETFSSLDLSKALPELVRVLRSDGFLIGIETFGHNPFTNLKRKINKITGKRTEWVTEHIIKTGDLKTAKNYFGKVEVYFFHLISWIIFPFLGLPGFKFLLKLLEKVDGLLLKLPLLKKYSFKIVFVFSQPRK